MESHVQGEEGGEGEGGGGSRAWSGGAGLGCTRGWGGGKVPLTLLWLQEWDRKAEDARRDYEKAMKEYSAGSRAESSR